MIAFPNTSIQENMIAFSLRCKSFMMEEKRATVSSLIAATRGVPEAEYLIQKGTENGFETNNG